MDPKIIFALATFIGSLSVRWLWPSVPRTVAAALLGCAVALAAWFTLPSLPTRTAIAGIIGMAALFACVAALLPKPQAKVAPPPPPAPRPGNSIVSNNQMGGIVANNVHIKNEAPAPEVIIREKHVAQRSDGKKTTTFVLEVKSPYPAASLTLNATAKGVGRIGVLVHPSTLRSSIEEGHAGERGDYAFTTISRPYGTYTISIAADEEVHLTYDIR